MQRKLGWSLGLGLVAGAVWWAAAASQWNLAGDPSARAAFEPAGQQQPLVSRAGVSLVELLGDGLLEARTPAEVRTVVRYCSEAGAGDEADLRRVARESADPLVTANALSALGRLELVDVAFIEPFLTDERMRVRQAAVIALAGSDQDRAVDRLAGFVQPDADPTERTLAIRALGRVGGERARDTLAALGEHDGLTEVDRVFLQSALREAAQRGRVPAGSSSPSNRPSRD